MSFPPKSDLWHVGILLAPLATFLEPARLPELRDRIVWLPDPGLWRYLADPFGVRRGDTTHVFVEAYDYRTKHAVIEHHAFDSALRWQGKNVALTQPVHLSYPYLFEDAGEAFMMPESCRADEVAIYRARSFPLGWEKEAVLLSNIRAADATPVFYAGCWWLFFTLVGERGRDRRELHAAYADTLTGPWHLHPQMPALVDQRGARPGGTPFVDATGALVLPVQDCHGTYGAATRFLRFLVLNFKEIRCAHLNARVTGDLFSPRLVDGCHTLSACGDLTLFDVKRVTRSLGRYAIDLQRQLRHKLTR
jgi:hypothetical protein